MLTMPKLIAGVVLALIALVVTGQIKTAMLAEYGSYNFGLLVPVAVAIGFLCGWVIIGSRANGQLGFSIAPSVGVSGVVAMVFWVLLLMTLNEMLRLAMARRYDGGTEALTAIVPIGTEYGRHLLHSNILLTLLVGGMFAGWLADWSARRWR